MEVAPEKIALNMVPQWMYLPEQPKDFTDMALEVSVQKGSKFVPALSGEKKKVRKSLTCRKLLLLTSVLKEQFDMPVIRAIAPKVIGGEDRAHKGLSKRQHQNMCGPI